MERCLFDVNILVNLCISFGVSFAVWPYCLTWFLVNNKIQTVRYFNFSNEVLILEVIILYLATKADKERGDV